MKRNKFNLFHSLGFLILGTILGKATGFLKHYLIVYLFSISQFSDAFFIANMIPELVVNIFISGLLAGAFIPIAGEILAKDGEKRFADFVSGAFFIIGIIGLIISLTLFLVPQFFSTLLAPEYKNEQKIIVENLLKYFSPGILFLGWSAILSGILQSLEDFRIVSFGLFIFNLIFIICVFAFKDVFGIYAAGVGVSVGAFFWFLSHYIYSFHNLKITINFKAISEYVNRTLRLSLPSVLIILISNLILILEKNLASAYPAGTISELNLAFRMTNLFLVISIFPLSTVLLPRLSKYFTNNQFERISRMLNTVLTLITIALILILVLFLFNMTLITNIVYHFLKIKAQSFQDIANYALMYSLAFIGLFYYMFLIRVFYASQKTWEIVKANLLGLTAYLFTYYFFEKYFQSKIFPIAYAIYAIITVGYLFKYLSSKMFLQINAIFGQKSLHVFNVFFVSFILVFKLFCSTHNVISNLIFSLTFLIFYILVLTKFELLNIKKLREI